MTFQNVLDEALADAGIRGVRAARAITQDNLVHHGQRRNQLRPGLLGQYRPHRVRHLHYQEPAGRRELAQAANVLGQQWIEVAGNPLAVAPSQFVTSLNKQNDFGACIQDA